MHMIFLFNKWLCSLARCNANFRLSKVRNVDLASSGLSAQLHDAEMMKNPTIKWLNGK